jgi:hypothetical protein
VYIFATEPAARHEGESDIFYIGKANSLRDWVGKHLYRVRRSAQRDVYSWVGPERSPEQGIASLVDEGSLVEIGWFVTDTAESALRREAELLRAYTSEHGQLPPNNRRG